MSATKMTETPKPNQLPRPKWHERLRALNNVRPILRMVWDAAPGVVTGGVVSRLLAALVPVAMLWVTKLIIDAIQTHPLPAHFWWLVVLEFALASVATILGRVGDYCDTVLGDRYARYISTRIIEHASRLDLTSYEDPVFYDKLEPARVQGTDRIAMIQ